LIAFPYLFARWLLHSSFRVPILNIDRVGDQTLLTNGIALALWTGVGEITSMIAGRGQIHQESVQMPKRSTIERARKDAVEGKSPSTQAGEFVREEIEHIREGKHGARSAKQAIAIGLSKARRAGVKLPPPDPSKTSPQTRRKAAQDTKAAGKKPNKPSARRSRAAKSALKHEGHEAASPRALSRQARTAAAKRSRQSRSATAKKAARTKASRRKSKK
jgi:hypothetical protein